MNRKATSRACAAIYALAVKERLPGERVEQIIAGLPHDEVEIEKAAVA